MKLILITTLFAHLGGNIYLFVRSLQQMSGVPMVWKVIFGVLFWLLALSIFIAIGARNTDMPEAVARLLFQAGSVWMVFLLYMVLALIVVDMVHLVCPAFNGYFYALALTIALLAYGNWNYHHPSVERVEITLDKPLESVLRIVAVSDVHLGYGTDKKALERYVELINSEHPDVVLIAGDLIDNSVKPVVSQQMNEELNKIAAPQGVYMVMGNHEFISGAEAVERFIGTTNIHLLRDSVVTLPSGLQIVGREDRTNRQRQALEQLITECDNTRPIVLLDHQPYNVAGSDSLKVDLQFSGHTHRGQIFPLNLLTDCIYEQSHGYRKWSYSHIIVSCGLSLWGPPFRIGTSSDMYVITLRGR